ncbi:MAG: GNAT family N-acetyltransferase [Flavobacteriaceae bacterium]
MELPFVDNLEKKRFEVEVAQTTAFIEYIRTKDSFYLTHTEVPSELEGKGIGSSLVKRVLEHIEKEALLVAPLCPFVAAYIKRHPEWKRLLARGYHV